MLEANKFKLGLFVTFSFVAFFGVVIALGLFDVFRPKARVMTLFTESVQGLDNGCPVKYRGVPIGKVSDITISAKEKLIRVDMEINLQKVRTEKEADAPSKPPISPEQLYAFLDTEINAGLRCRLELAGITGMKYVEIDYMDTASKGGEFLASPGIGPDGYYYIPSTPSLLSGLRNSLSDTLSKIAMIDYKKIADEMSSALNTATALFGDPKLKNLIASTDNVAKELEVSAKNLNATFTGQRMDKLAGEISTVIKSMNDLAIKSREAIEAAQLDKTSASFRDAVRAVMESRDSFSATMMKFNETLDALIEFVNYIDEDPSSLIKGKQKSPLFEKGRLQEGQK